MKALFQHVERDETGALIFGSPNITCPWCHAPAELTYGTTGKAGIWHAPLNCCDKRRERQRRAYYASTRDHAAQDEADQRATRTSLEPA